MHHPSPALHHASFITWNSRRVEYGGVVVSVCFRDRWFEFTVPLALRRLLGGLLPESGSLACSNGDGSASCVRERERERAMPRGVAH